MISLSELAAEPFAGWDGSVAAARSMQARLAEQVRLEDDFPPLQRFAGVDVGFEGVVRSPVPRRFYSMP
jgi:deoxyribonuclease V